MEALPDDRYDGVGVPRGVGVRMSEGEDPKDDQFPKRDRVPWPRVLFGVECAGLRLGPRDNLCGVDGDAEGGDFLRRTVTNRSSILKSPMAGEVFFFLGAVFYMYKFVIYQALSSFLRKSISFQECLKSKW